MTFAQMRPKGIQRFYDLWEVLSKDIVGPHPVEAFHWDDISEEDQVFVEIQLAFILPYFDALQKLPVIRQQEIITRVRAVVYGEVMRS